VRDATNRVELALVFDNTGSMNCGNVQTGSYASNWNNPGPSSRIVALEAPAALSTLRSGLALLRRLQLAASDCVSIL